MKERKTAAGNKHSTGMAYDFILQYSIDRINEKNLRTLSTVTV